eukprot:TRINITY_DN16561_c0_g1_i1.p1 TRINITY_DN16561_c0_g1~~TRINITY_DN16561_c0_g1_i1.p1  ORF type:complete len:126 (-),score=11.98 TRINITY_DN16561_c0_g1_i1:161-538(-)
MSWQGYTDQLVGHELTHGMIIGMDGNVWSSTPLGCRLGLREGMCLVEAFNDPVGIYDNGLNLMGFRYIVLRAGDRAIYAKRGAGGVAAVKTGKCIVVGIYDEHVQPGQANVVVEKMADYLIENGY